MASARTCFAQSSSLWFSFLISRPKNDTKAIRSIGRERRSFQKSIPRTYQNRCRKMQSPYLRISFADCVNRHAITLTKRIRNYLKPFAIHFNVLGPRKA
jgi:hypothetical protein